MDARPGHDLTAALEGALGWWRDAGVTYDFADRPRGWIAVPHPPTIDPPTAAPPQPVTPEVPRMGGDQTGWPENLAQFSAWWMSEPTLADGTAAERVAPAGPVAAKVMVLVEQPEAEDRETLLSAAEGKLLAGFLLAAGIDRSKAYIASVLPRHTPMADWSALQAGGLGEVTRHHVALAAPERLIAFGSNILPLLSHDPAKNSTSSGIFNQEGASIPVMPALSLKALLAAPRRKAALWRDWLSWTGTAI